MDVLHVIHQFAPETRGGSESYVQAVAQRQRARGIDAQVLTGSMQWREQVEIDSFELDGLPVHRLHRNDFYFDHHAKAWHPEVERRFAELLQRLRPRLLHVHHWLRLTSNLIEVATAQAVPAVVTLHDYYTSCARAFRRRRDDMACQRVLSVASCADCVPRFGHETEAEVQGGIELYRDSYRSELALARKVLVAVGSTADLLAATTGVPRQRYEVLPFGYEPRFAGQARLAAPAEGAAVRFAFWGGVGRHKGVDVLLAAMRLLHSRRPGRAALHVLGGFESPAFEAELRAAAAGLPVTFHGAFDAAELHAAAPHVGVFPSTCLETYGIVLDECFELGLPCIVTGLGALGERAGGAALHVPPGKTAELATAMLRFCDEPGLWPRLAAAVPGPPPTLDAHLDGLRAVYATAMQATPEVFAPPVPLQRRLALLLRQRESALARLSPGGPKD